MKTLMLLRHARSSWDDPHQADHDRPLNERGLRDAPRVGALLAARKLMPDAIVSSPARRAAETARAVRAAAEVLVDIEFDPRIYEASTGDLLEVVRGLKPSSGVALLVGHNPGLEGLVRLLTERIEPMPTAALAVIQLNIDGWHAAGEGPGDLVDLFRPKEI